MYNLKQNFYNCGIIKWYFYKYFNIPKNVEIFKIEKTSVHYWKNKEKKEIVCRQYQFNIFDILIIKRLKRLSCLFLFFAHNPIGFILSTDTASTNNKDTYIDQEIPDSSFSTDTVIRMQDYYNTNIRRGLVNFIMSSGSGTITAVKLYLYCTYLDNSHVPDFVINAHALVQLGWTDNATWNKYNGSNAWTAAGGDYSATVVDAVTVNSVAWWAFILMGTGSDNPLTLNWGNEVNILLKYNNENKWTTNHFASKEYVIDTAKRPYLEITYTPPAAGPVNLKTAYGLAKASISTKNGLAMASSKTWNGLD